MRRLLTSATAALCISILGFGSSLASASPVSHVSISATEILATDGPIVCQVHSYSFTSGTMNIVFRDSTVGAHITMIGVHAVDETSAVYQATGAETYSDPTTFISKVSFIRQGVGRIESVNIVGHLSPNGSWHYFDFGNCSY